MTLLVQNGRFVKEEGVSAFVDSVAKWCIIFYSMVIITVLGSLFFVAVKISDSRIAALLGVFFWLQSITVVYLLKSDWVLIHGID